MTVTISALADAFDEAQALTVAWDAVRNDIEPPVDRPPKTPPLNTQRSTVHKSIDLQHDHLGGQADGCCPRAPMVGVYDQSSRRTSIIRTLALLTRFMGAKLGANYHRR